MQAKSDNELISAIEGARNEITRLDAMGAQAIQEAARARGEASQAETDAKQLETLHGTLKAAVPCDALEPEPIVIPEEVATFANGLISKFRVQNSQLEVLRGKAREAFRVLTKAATSKELGEVEPELARDVADSEFEPACSDRVRIAALIEDRINATQDTLDGMRPDFENCAGELYNLTYEGIGLLNHACAKTMPISTPYVGGKHILKMKSSFTGISVDAGRKRSASI